MALNKRTQAQRAADLAQTERLHLQGKTQYEIAEIISSQRPYTLSRQQVDYDLGSLAVMWRAEAVATRDASIAKELAQIKMLQSEYWTAWESSKTERTKARQETDGTKDRSGKPIVKKSSMEKEQRDGNPAFLQGVLSCIDRRCKLLGLDAPVKQQNLNVDLSTLTDEQLDRLDAGESIEQVLKRDGIAA
jgi:hypothetical protein